MSDKIKLVKIENPRGGDELFVVVEAYYIYRGDKLLGVIEGYVMYALKKRATEPMERAQCKGYNPSVYPRHKSRGDRRSVKSADETLCLYQARSR